MGEQLSMNAKMMSSYLSLIFMIVICLILPTQDTLAAPTISIGSPQNGALLHPKKLRNSKYLNVRKNRNYGTDTLVQVIEDAMRHVHRHHPEAPKLYVGDLSDIDGGRLARHKSHQCGRDADIGYFRDGPLHEEHRLIGTKPKQLDLYRTWTLLSYLIDHPKVQAIFSDKRLIKALYQHAKSLGHSESDLRRWFGKKVGSKYSGSKLIHWDGHHTHFHLRVRADHTHRSWRDMNQKLDPTTLVRLKRKAKSRGKGKDKAKHIKTHVHAVDNSHNKVAHNHHTRPSQQTASLPLNLQPRRRITRSRASQRARRKAKEARMRARLLASRVRNGDLTSGGKQPINAITK